LPENAGLKAARPPPSSAARKTRLPALSELKTEWAQFSSADQTLCIGETTIGGFASYVELLTCLEMARDAATSNNNPDDPRTKPKSGPSLAGWPGFAIGEGRWRSEPNAAHAKASTRHQFN
jgi:hypothetical protein